MESLPSEMLFLIFQNLDPLELVSLSRVNRRWRKVALSPQLHRSISFHRKQNISSTVICNYICKFKDTLQELNLQECYWLKGDSLCALRKCRKLTSLNVLGCSVTKKTLCSVLKLNVNLKTLAWSINARDLHLPSPSVTLSREVFAGLLVSFLSGLSVAFKGLNQLTIRLPVFTSKFKDLVQLILKQGIPIICSELHLKTFAVQWFDTSGSSMHCIPEMVIKGSADFQFGRRELKIGHYSDSFLAVLMKTIYPELENGSLRTFISPCNMFICSVSDVCDEHIKSLGSKSSLVNMDLGALALQNLDCLTTILSAQSWALRYLNLTRMVVTGHMLQVIATSSPNLEFLNLQNCQDCLTPIQGLESLALCCTKLAQLNLNGVHYDQPSEENSNRFIEITSKFTNLVSLSLCTCMTCQASNTEREGCQSTSLPLGTFDFLTRECNKITEFELFTTQPQNDFVKRYHEAHYGYRPQAEHATEKCSTLRMTYDSLLPIANWKHLQRLTLSVPHMQGSLKFLVAIGQNCPNLEFLSLANLGYLLSHSGKVALLKHALSCCHQLRDFRLEQKSIPVTESFMLSLGELKHLERVCIITSGPLKIASQAIISLFEKCHRLIYFHLICDMTIKASKRIMDTVKKRFSDARPGLIVVLGPFRRMSTGTYQAEIPFVHLKELFLFGTSVANSVPV